MLLFFGEEYLQYSFIIFQDFQKRVVFTLVKVSWAQKVRFPTYINKVCGVCFFKKENINLDELRFMLFDKRSSSDLKSLPPFRCACQSGWVCGNTLAQQNPFSSTSWGWISNEGLLRLKWTALSVQQNLQKAIVICQSRTDKCQTFRYGKNNFRCLRFCNCSRKCQNFFFLFQ